MAYLTTAICICVEHVRRNHYKEFIVAGRVCLDNKRHLGVNKRGLRMTVFQMRKLKVFRILGEHLYGSAFKKIEIISSLNDCNQACCIYLLLSHSRLHGSVSLCLSAALRPRMMSYQCRVNQCLTERGFLCVFIYRRCDSCWDFTCKRIPQ